MRNKMNIFLKQIGHFFAIFVIVLLALAICLYVFHIPAFYPQILAIIASACLGAGVTAWITKSLLASQKESEEEKETVKDAEMVEAVKEKEAAVKTAGADFEGGSMQSMVEYGTGADYTRKRVEYLMGMYFR